MLFPAVLYRIGVLCLLVVLATGCAQPDEIDLSPPEGWTQAGMTKWWVVDTDTTAAFRPLETLTEMSIAEGQRTYVASLQFAQQGGAARQEFARAVKQELVALFRNEPQLVDSLFEAEIRERLPEVNPSEPIGEQVEDAARDAYTRMRRHFREARPKLQLGTDVPVPFPDSLMQTDIQGSVRMQAYLNEAGEPVGVYLIEGLHPVLDAIAMRATTEMRWEPAYLLVNNQWEAMPSWVWYSIRFQAPGAS